jgi:integrase
MAFVYRNKKKDGTYSREYYYGYKDADGKVRRAKGTINKAQSLQLALKQEADAQLVRTGLVRASDQLARQAATLPLETHLAAYRAYLEEKKNTPSHNRQTLQAITRLLQLSKVKRLSDLQIDALHRGLGELRTRRSARTANYARTAVLGWLRWLFDSKRLAEMPAGVLRLKPFNQRTDRRWVRRTITAAELFKLLTVTEAAPVEYSYGPTKSKLHQIPLTGVDRAMLYLTAMGTGFRASELKSLTPESFRLTSDTPAVLVEASCTKNKKEALQPIRHDLAVQLQRWLATKPPQQRLWQFDKFATLLKRDLKRADIAYIDETGRVLDGHALRHSYITHLIQAGVMPKEAQVLARHSTITLTMDYYAQLENAALRTALERKLPDASR